MRRAPNGARLSMPVLFVNGDRDQMNSIGGDRSGDPMRVACADLTIVSLEGAHWLPLERKTELSGAMADWIAVKQL